jgi:hypothetical protein
VAGLAGAFAQRMLGETSAGRMVKTIAPTLILAIVVFMVLTQLKIAPTIVTATYIALIGMLALAGALAFGLGGREVAADMLRNAYDSTRDNQDRIKQDLRTGRDRAQAQAGRLRDGGQDRSAPGARPASTPGI